MTVQMSAQELAALARSGDDLARDQLIEMCLHRARPMAWSFAQSTGLDADDLLQDVAEKLWIKWARVVQVERPVGYALAVARSVMLWRYRVQARRREIAPMVSMDVPLGESDLTLAELIPAREVTW
jgi:DNA-directed RNA polymerase specialized sigma24 family protein